MRNRTSRLVSSLAYIALMAGTASAEYNSAPQGYYRYEPTRTEQTAEEKKSKDLVVNIVGTSMVAGGLALVIILDRRRGGGSGGSDESDSGSDPNDDFGRSRSGDGRIGY